MSELLQWILGILALTAIGLYLARRWLDEQDRTKGPP